MIKFLRCFEVPIRITGSFVAGVYLYIYLFLISPGAKFVLHGQNMVGAVCVDSKRCNINTTIDYKIQQ